MTSAPSRPQVSHTHRDGPDAVVSLVVSADLMWFHGHYDGFPVLPALAHVHWAVEFGRELLGLDLPAAQGLQVRLKQPVFPGDHLDLHLHHDTTRRQLRFEVRRHGAVCSHGQVDLP